MKKDEMIEVLKKYNINTDDMNYKEIQKLYFAERKKGTFDLPQEDVVEHKDTDVNETTPDSIRERLINDIIIFVDSMKGKTRGTPTEIRYMFSLYNNFYKRHESPNCAICIGNVFNKLKGVHKKYSK